LLQNREWNLILYRIFSTKYETFQDQTTHILILISLCVLCSNWIISTQPKYIEITGGRLQAMLGRSGSIETDFMNLGMRRFQQQDVAFAEGKMEGCWRLFIEADFAVIQLRVKPLHTLLDISGCWN
jgi:hypothetical protein